MKRSAVILLVLLLALSLFGCTGSQSQETTPPPTEPPVTEPPMPTADEAYAQAVAAVEEMDRLKLTVTAATDTTVGEDTVTGETAQELLLTGIGTDGFQAMITEQETVGDRTLTSLGIYTGDTLYLTLEDAAGTYRFSGLMESQMLRDSLVPAVILDIANYTDVSIAETGENYIITFAGGIAGESWAVPAFACVAEAGGTATVSREGVLVESSYSVTYTLGGYTTTQTVTVAVEDPEEEVQAPGDINGYRQVSDVLAAQLYAAAGMRLAEAGSIVSTSVESVISTAENVGLVTQEDVAWFGRDSELAACVGQYWNRFDGRRWKDQFQTEYYSYNSVTLNKSEGKEEKYDQTPEGMGEYCREFVAKNLLSPDYIKDIRWDHVGGIYYLEMTLNTQGTDALNAYASSRLFEDEAYLTQLSGKFDTSYARLILTVEEVQLQPTALRLEYLTNHTVEDTPYPMQVQVTQSFAPFSQDAEAYAKGSPVVDAQAEVEPTPLFYHVTGQEGQQMWLMGTIHVGDNRTGNLPIRIKAALAASDALAVECDMDAMNESTVDAEKLAEKIARCYYYLDGSTIEDHLPKEVYDYGKMMMIATGTYDESAEMMKPFVWESTISSFYLELGRNLSARWGVDNQLMALAREKEIEILEVESVLFQMEMFSDFSQDLQTAQLAGVLSYTASEQCAETEALYEMWCAGDEEELKAYFAQENQETLTPDQQALADEYNQVVSIDRNEGMLEKAKEYLESGDVIFYAVGLAHLLDPTNGLVQALQDAGYTVELITFG